jgi:predicted GNAT family N-acyltransferase
MIHVNPITNPQDMAKAFDIRRIVFVIEQACPPDEEYDEHENSSNHCLATQQGLAVGTCRYRDTEYGCKLERFAVLKEHRGSGAGAALLQHCLRTLSPSFDFSKGHIYLHAQEHAMGFYEKYGFVAKGDRFFEAGIPHFKMIYQPESDKSY